jgi:hypothetical protein
MSWPADAARLAAANNMIPVLLKPLIGCQSLQVFAISQVQCVILLIFEKRPLQ